MRVAIAGVSGFFGSRLSEFLSARGHSVYGLDLVPPSQHVQESLAGFQAVDLASPSISQDSLPPVDCLILLAALLPLGVSPKRNEEANLAICGGFEQLIDQVGPRQVVFTSSSSVYDPRTKGLFGQCEVERPLGGYGRAKLESELRLERKSRHLGAKFCVLRPTPIIGPGRAGLFGVLENMVSRRWPIPLPGDDNLVLQITGVEDLCSIVAHVIELEIVGRFPTGNPSPVSVATYVKALAAKHGVRPRVIPIPRWLFEFIGLIASSIGFLRLTRWHALTLSHPHGFENAFLESLGYEYGRDCVGVVIRSGTDSIGFTKYQSGKL